MSSTTPLFVQPDAPTAAAAHDTQPRAGAASAGTEAEPVWHSDDVELPKQPAVNRAIAAGVAYGLDDAQAAAYAFAVTDPTALRTGYQNPMRMAALGGYFEVLDVEVFVPAVVPLPTNNRVLEYLVFPAGGADGYAPLAAPTSPPGEATELAISATGPAHLIDAADRAADNVLKHNAKMLPSIREQGIAMPLTLVGLRVDHADGNPSVHLVACADGSSRVTNAQRSLLSLDTARTHYEFSRDARELRREIGRILTADGDADPAAAAQKRRALTAPARLILKFVPSRNRPGTFSRAVSAYVGLMHVEAPTPWSEASRSEAKAEVVLQTLLNHDWIDETEMTYLAARMTPEQAAAAGRPSLLDEQAASVLAALLPNRVAPLVKQGIREVTGQSRVETGGLVDTVADLAMRATRGLPDDQISSRHLKLMRARYTRASRLEHYRSKEWTVTGRPIDEIHTAALAELADPDAASWTARLELAALGQYHLTRKGVLTREAYGAKAANDDDMRGPHEILERLLDHDWGLHILKQAVVDGRGGVEPRRVDEDGRPSEMLMNPDWLKQEVAPRPADPKAPVEVDDESLSAGTRLARLRLQFTASVHAMTAAQKALAGPAGDDGVPLIDREGWPAEDARQLVEELRDVQDRLTVWAAKNAESAQPLTSMDAGEQLDDDADEPFDERVD